MIAALGGELAMLAPSFVLEPPSLVQYAAGAGVSVRCVARADPPPQLSWLAADGTALRDLPGRRYRTLYSGSTPDEHDNTCNVPLHWLNQFDTYVNI